MFPPDSGAWWPLVAFGGAWCPLGELGSLWESLVALGSLIRGGDGEFGTQKDNYVTVSPCLSGPWQPLMMTLPATALEVSEDTVSVVIWDGGYIVTEGSEGSRGAVDPG